jgi:phosphohistidine phosphatase
VSDSTGPGRGQRLRLHLLRHTKSAWDDPWLDDHDRPLAPRGIRAAAALERFLAGADVHPTLVVCSPAVRTRATLDAILPVLGRPDVELEPALYHASTELLLRLIRTLPGGVTEAMIVGHNPGLQEIALALAQPGPVRERIEAKFPTGALSTLDVPGHRWDEVDPGTCTAHRLVLPRDLDRAL